MTTEPSRPRWIWWLNGAGAVIGLVGLVVLWRSIGTTEITDRLRAAGSAVALVVGIDVVLHAIRARVLHRMLRRRVPYGRVVIAQMSGGAVADVTPTGVLGEATKVSMLFGHAPTSTVVSGVVSYDLVSLYASTVVLIGGLAIAAATGAVSPELAQLLALAALLLACVAVVAFALARRGLSASLLGLLSPSRRARWRSKLDELDGVIRELHGRRRGDALAGIALHLVIRSGQWLQLYIMLRALGVDVTAHTFVLLVLAQGPVMRLAAVLPLGVGLTDVGIAGVFTLLGLPAAAGASLAMLQRLRMVLTAAIGLTTMVIGQVTPPGGVRRRTLPRPATPAG